MSFRYRLPEGRPVGSMTYAPARNALDGTVTDLVKSDAVTTGAAIACVYHGYRRTGSLIWALIWGVAGKKLPVVAVPVALAQGFARRKTFTTE